MASQDWAGSEVWETDGGPWPIIVACAVAVPEAISLVAALLQRSRIGGPVPQELEGIYDPGEYEVSNRYTKAKSNLSLMKDVYDLAIFFGFWFLRGFPWLDNLCMRAGFKSQIHTGLVFLAGTAIASSLLDLPWSIYRTFWLEERFGFNKTTPWTFVKDRLKGLALMVVLGGPLMYVTLWFFITEGSTAWLLVFVTMTTVQLILLFLMPVLILPLFMEMIPLPSGTALVTGEAGKEVPGFLSSRLFYTMEGDVNREPCWVTKDRRFAGAKAGAALSISWLEPPPEGVAGVGVWAMAEGQPGEAGTVYATTRADLRQGKPGAEGTPWVLTAAGESAAHGEAGDDFNSSGSPAPSGADPLIKEGLRTTCADVGSLRSKLLALADKLGYHGASIFVIDGSTRSAHSNAFCTGFGRFRRICLFDTLLPLMGEDEIVAVLGHEIGHDRLYHVHTRLVVSILYTFVMLYALGQFLTSKAISLAFFVHEPKVYLGIVLFSIVWSVVDFVMSIPLTVQSRMNEFAADRFAVDASPSYGPLLGSALKKLMRKSKANLTPHPFYVFLTYSHPPLDVRLKAIKEYAGVKYPGS